MRLALLTRALAVVMATLLPSAAALAEPRAPQTERKLDKALQEALRRAGGGQVPVIIQTTDAGRVAVARTLAAKGHPIAGEFRNIGAISAAVDVADLAALVADPAVTAVSLDAPIAAHATLPGPDSFVTLDAVRNDIGSRALTTLTGRGVGVAVIDSGIANIPDVHDQMGPFYDFTNGGKATAAFDDCGHGTHIAATIGSSGKQNGYLYQGIAPKVRLIGLKVLDKKCAGTTSAVLNALAFATANKAALGIDVINLSLGHPIYESAATDPLVRAVEAAVRAGIVVVVSAGNNGRNPTTGLVGYGGITSPGNAPSAITVGAVNTSGTLNRSDDFVAAYSSRGPSWFDGYAKPDLVAPGHRIVADTTGSAVLYKDHSTWRVAAPAGASGQYMRLSGSSMSVAVASGIVALVLEANRTALQADGTAMASLNPYAVKAILQYTATPLAGADALAQGTGEINAGGAIALTRAIDTRASTWTTYPLVTTSTFGSEVDAWSNTLIAGATKLATLAPGVALNGANVLWGENIVWGENILWGDNVLWGENILWGDNIVWGENLVWGENILWGENVVWGENIVWGENVVYGDNVVWGEFVDD
ncbi:MAG TPA: S8 family serine peptidase [Vicinamibacterales bacterium]|nr:S8 family serine peptidase [Vicinamibacterales bacterium]